MAERIAFRGRTPTELLSLEMEEYMKMINSRERRSIRRNPTNYKKLVEKANWFKQNNIQKAVRTQLREAVIVPTWVGMKFEVYDGKEYKQVHVSANMLGHRLGEYVYSTKRVLHSAPGIRATRGSKFLAVK